MKIVRGALQASICVAYVAWRMWLWDEETERQRRLIQATIRNSQAKYDAMIVYLEALSPRQRRRFVRAYLKAGPEFINAYFGFER